MTPHYSRSLVVSVALLVGIFANTTASAYPVCPPGPCCHPGPTLVEETAHAQVLLLARWISADKQDDSPQTVFEIEQVVRNHGDVISKGERVTLPLYWSSAPGTRFLLTAHKPKLDAKLDWHARAGVTTAVVDYILQAPALEAPSNTRLEYYLKFLESSDSVLANDAHREFEQANFKAYVQICGSLPRDRLREWAISDKTPPERRGLYGVLIGLCGTPEDAKAVEAKLLQTPDDFHPAEKAQELRPGIDGLMFGYLLMMGERGLDVLDEAKLRNKDVIFSETHAALNAIRLMWQYGEGKIAPERLRQSIRLLLERPELTDLVIGDLARWKDWSVQDRLMKMYGEGEFDIPSTKRAIVRYMLDSTQDLPKEAGPDAKVPEHVERGRKHLEELRQKDPKTVSEAERVFFPAEQGTLRSAASNNASTGSLLSLWSAFLALW